MAKRKNDHQWDLNKDGDKFHNLKFKENVYTSVSEYLKSENYFSRVYENWLQARKDTLQKLRTLIRDLHKDQLEFNKSQQMFREAGFASRSLKSEVESGAFGFLATVSAILSDAASGITSVAQAANVDTYQTKFQEIIDCDAKITKGLYEARSRYMAKYHGVEEVMRKFQSKTFDSTVKYISNALELSKFCEAVKTAYENDDMNKLMSLVGNFIDRGCQFEVLVEVYKSVDSYVNDNPAALDACISAGRAVYGVVDSLNKNENGESSQVSVWSNRFMMGQDALEISKLRCTIEEGLSQSKFEDKVQDFINSLRFEMEEMINAYFQQFGNK